MAEPLRAVPRAVRIRAVRHHFPVRCRAALRLPLSRAAARVSRAGARRGRCRARHPRDFCLRCKGQSRHGRIEEHDDQAHDGTGGGLLLAVFYAARSRYRIRNTEYIKFSENYLDFRSCILYNKDKPRKGQVHPFQTADLLTQDGGESNGLVNESSGTQCIPCMTQTTRTEGYYLTDNHQR